MCVIMLNVYVYRLGHHIPWPWLLRSPRRPPCWECRWSSRPSAWTNQPMARRADTDSCSHVEVFRFQHLHISNITYGVNVGKHSTRGAVGIFLYIYIYIYIYIFIQRYYIDVIKHPSQIYIVVIINIIKDLSQKACWTLNITVMAI